MCHRLAHNQDGGNHGLDGVKREFHVRKYSRTARCRCGEGIREWGGRRRFGSFLGKVESLLEKVESLLGKVGTLLGKVGTLLGKGFC